MNYKRIIFFLFFLFFLINNSYSTNNLNLVNFVNITIKNISIDENNNYFLEILFENKMNSKLEYNLEVIYLEDIIITKSENISCEQTCEKKVFLDKVFFGNHNLMIIINYENNSYSKIIPFKIESPRSSYDILLEPTYYINNGQIKVVGELIMNTVTPSIFEFEIFPKSAPKEKQIFKINCEGKCNFEHIISSPVIIDDYVIRIYSMHGDLEKFFKTIYSIVPESKKENKEEKNIELNEIKQKDNKINENQKEDSFKAYNKNKNGKETSGYFLYDNKGRKGDEIRTKIKKNNIELLPIEVSTLDTYDVEFEFNSSSKVKRIKIPNTRIENLSIGVEDVKPNGIVGVPESIVSAFAINPILPSPIGFFEVNFTATGTSLYKCELYNFTTQTCFGSYKFLMATIPGQDYILNLTGVDPLFVNTIANTSNDGRAAAGVFQLDIAPVRFGNVAGVLYDAYFRFDKVAVPPGSVVTNAYINFTPAATRATLTTNGKIYGFKEVNCIHFDAPNGGDNPVDNTRTGNFSLWNNVAAWTNAVNNAGTQSTNISTIIQEIIALPSWEVNNSICIVVLNNGSSNNAYRDIQTVGATPAKLYVNYANPNSYVMWLPISKTLSSYAGLSSNSIVNVTSIMDNTNVTISEIGGNGSSFISINMTSLINMSDNQKKSVLFDCSSSGSQASGTYESIFNVKSNQFTSGTNITISCVVSSSPQLNMIYPSTSNYANVTDGQNLILKFNITDTGGNLITNFTDVLNVTVGNINLNITPYSNMTFISNFSLASKMTTPQGIAVYGNKMWITSLDKTGVFSYYTNGTFINYYNLSAVTTDPKGIATLDGTQFWVVDNGAVAPNDVVIHFDSNFKFIDTFSVATQTINPWGIAYDGTTFYVEDDTTDRILRYNSAGVYQSTFSIATYTTTPRGIAVYGNELWIVDDTGTAPNDLLLHYYTNGTYIDAFSVAAQTTLPIGISTYNGKQFFVADTTLDRVLFYESENTRYNQSGFFEVNVTLPSGLADFQNISINVMTYPDSEFILSTNGINALNFGEKVPPGTISNLQNISKAATWIYWNWTNPIDSDFSYVQVWLNGSWIANVTKPTNYHNTTGLLANTNYTLSTRTVDINGNINTTWVNKTGSTSGYPLIQNITPLNSTNFYQNQNVTLSANITHSSGIDSVSVYIIWDSGAQTLNMTDSNGDNLYEVNFTNTIDFATYNFTITAINNLGDSTVSNQSTFFIISNTPFLDTYVRSDIPATSYSAATRIMVSSVATSLRRGMLRFDISYLPTGVRIDSAVIQLYLATYGGTAVNHSIFAINSTWNSTTTWNTQPSFLATNYNTTRISAALVWYNFNITSLSQNWYNGSITNYGVMIKEATEVTLGTNQYRSAEAGTLIPFLNISYTDITYPQVTNINTIDTTYHVKDNISIKVQVTDNIGVSSVYANISWPTGSERLNLTSIGSFQYAANYTNLTYQGVYNITIIANDTTNLINNSLLFYFNTTYLNLKVLTNITKISNDNFNIYFELQNINFFQTPENKSIIIYTFIPNNFNMSSNFDISTSSMYITTNSSTNLNSLNYNGTIYKFILIPSLENTGVFDSYIDSFNQTNSWQLSFNITGIGTYDISKIIVSVE